MKIYQVGGSVRDKLLGLTPHDIDYVVVGSNEHEMIAMGHFQVGKGFPVFIGADGCEYALARKEIKKGAGRTNFTCDTKDITLVDDLERRDLTINSMALLSNGEIIDPFGGQEDIKNKILRHTSDAFSEDALRVLRLARFAARFPDFTIHSDTLILARAITQTDEYRDLPRERVFMEMESALKTDKPSRFFEVLKMVGGLEHYFPELAALCYIPQNPEYHPEGDCWVHTMLVLDQAASITKNVKVRFSALVHDLGKAITPLDILPAHHGHEKSGIALVNQMCGRLPVPNDWKESAIVMTANHLRVHQLSKAKASSIVRMFYEMDAYRKPHLVQELAQGCQADEMGKYKSDEDSKSQLEVYFKVTAAVGFKDSRPGLTGEAIATDIRQNRVLALKKFMNEE